MSERSKELCDLVKELEKAPKCTMRLDKLPAHLVRADILREAVKTGTIEMGKPNYSFTIKESKLVNKEIVGEDGTKFIKKIPEHTYALRVDDGFSWSNMKDLKKCKTIKEVLEEEAALPDDHRKKTGLLLRLTNMGEPVEA